MTGHGRGVILRTLHRFPDFNLFTQVLLNLQPYRFFSATQDAQSKRKALAASDDADDDFPEVPRLT